MSTPTTDRSPVARLAAAVRRIPTPLGWLAERVVLGPRALRWGTTAALVVSILIIVTGGVVRVTGSGLGCPTWPLCEPGSLTTTPELGVHGAIEFGNRALTGVLVAAVGWAIVAARLQPVRQRPLTRLAWSQFWLVAVNAVAGGVTVRLGLNPWIVAAHLVLAFALLTTTTLTWHRARQSVQADAAGGVAAPLAWALVAAAAVLVLLGTLVTGSGPHSGDAAVDHRLPFDWTLVTAVHGAAAVGVILLAATLLAAVRTGTPGAALVRRRLVVLLAVLGSQALIGVVQAVTGLPSALVVLHLLGAALVWVGALRVLLDVRPALFGRVVPLGATVPSEVVREPVRS